MVSDYLRQHSAGSKLDFGMEIVAAEGEEGGPEVRGAARRARCALGAVAAQALAQVRGALDAAGAGEGAAGFDAAAREYAETRRDILERAVASLGVF